MILDKVYKVPRSSLYMNLLAVLPILALVSIVGISGCTTLDPQAETSSQGDAMDKDGESMDDEVMKDDAMKDDDTMEDDHMDDATEGDAMDNDDDAMQDVMLQDFEQHFSLTSFANNYYRYDPVAYQAARDAGYVVFLDFHANWCPICASEKPNILAAFNGGGWNDVIGFQVHYKDSDTQPFDVTIAQQQGIAQQYTKVILDAQGSQVYKSTSVLNTATITSEIEKARA